MDAVRIAVLREVLTGTGWLEAARAFAGSLRSAVSRSPRGGGLLLVGTEQYEPWHLAAHLDDEAAWSGLPELSPTLIRRQVCGTEPAHLSYDLTRLEAARRGETLLVVTPDQVDAALLERVDGARRTGATVLAVDGGDPELHALAHEALAVPQPAPGGGPDVDFDVMQHLVSAAAGESGLGVPARRGRLRERMSRLVEQLTSPPPTSW